MQAATIHISYTIHLAPVREKRLSKREHHWTRNIYATRTRWSKAFRSFIVLFLSFFFSFFIHDSSYIWKTYKRHLTHSWMYYLQSNTYKHTYMKFKYPNKCQLYQTKILNHNSTKPTRKEASSSVSLAPTSSARNLKSSLKRNPLSLSLILLRTHVYSALS